MVELRDLALTASWHDADLISIQFMWAPDGAITSVWTSVLNPEEDIRTLVAFGITTHQVTIFFRNVENVQSVLRSNYSALPTIDDWSARTLSGSVIQQHYCAHGKWMPISASV